MGPTVPPARALPDAAAVPGEQMTHRQIMEALTGILLAMFVAIISSTVVSNALPTIVSDLGGTESGYTWVVTSTLLATTIATPIWGKLADLFSKKALIQVAIVVFVASSAVAGLSQNMATLITMRVFQGIGAGGLTALAQVVMATMIAPRERGRYSGYLGGVMALGTVGGPLIGGALTEHLSWHWCFYVGVPFAVLAFFVLQATLHLPVMKRKVHIDYLGAALIAAGVSSLLIWVSMAGHEFEWWSWQTALMTSGGVALLALALLAEAQAPEPIIPLRFFRNRTVALSSLASMFVGVAMFGATIFLSQYFQLARGDSPTEAGLRTLPMVGGLLLSSIVIGRLITRTGRWKAYVIMGGVFLTAGLALMSTVEWDTEYWLVSLYMFLIGLGVGAMMQNLVLAVQNVVEPRDLGAASSFVAFTRSLGGAIGVSALGAVLSNAIKDHLEQGVIDRQAELVAARIDPRAYLGTGIPKLAEIPEPLRTIIQTAYGTSIAELFLWAAPFAFVGLLVSFFLKETTLGSVAGGGPGAGAPSPAGDADTGAEVSAGAEGSTQRWNAPSDHETGSALATDRSLADDGSLALSGTVKHHGRTLPGVQVTVTDAAGNQVARTATDADGTYRVPLAKGGSYLVIAGSEGLSPSATMVSVGDHPVQRDVTLAGRSSIKGRVLRQAAGTSAPEGLASAVVTLVDPDGSVAGTVRTADDGSYHFTQLTPGSYVVTAQGATRRPVARSLEVPDDGVVELDVHVPVGGRVQGVVTAARTGAPVEEATVTVLDDDGQVVATTVSQEDGRYRLEDLPAGSYTVTTAGYAPVAHRVVVDAEGATELAVRLGQPAPQATPRSALGTARRDGSGDADGADARPEKPALPAPAVAQAETRSATPVFHADGASGRS